MKERSLLIDFFKSLCYNTFVRDSAEVCTVEYNYGFLFKKSSLSKVSLNALLSLDSFVSEADAITKKGNALEDKDIYNIVKKLLFPKLKNGEKSRESGILYRSINKFSKTLFADEKFWESEYESFLNK